MPKSIDILYNSCEVWPNCIRTSPKFINSAKSLDNLSSQTIFVALVIQMLKSGVQEFGKFWPKTFALGFLERPKR